MVKSVSETSGGNSTSSSLNYLGGDTEEEDGDGGLQPNTSIRDDRYGIIMSTSNQRQEPTQTLESILEDVEETNALEVLSLFDIFAFESSHQNGIYVDTGGGSSEVILYDKRQIGFVASLPVGSLNLYNKYVKNIIPTKSEIKEIQERILKELNAIDRKKSVLKADDLSVTGGSMRAIRSLLISMRWIEKEVYEFDASMLRRLVKSLQEDESKTIHLFLKVKPDRVHTMFTGLLIIDTIAQYTKAKRIQVSTNGVREGYLMEKILGE